MNESFLNFESKPEQIPTLEEVRGKLKELIEGEYEEGRNLSDEEGLYLLKAKVPPPGGGSPHEWKEYADMRKGCHEECKILQTGIDVADWKDGSVEWGEIVVECTDGEWRLSD